MIYIYIEVSSIFNPGWLFYDRALPATAAKDVFHSRSCHGAVYNVLAANSTSSEDFEKAVDRTHMALNHAAPSVGIDVLASLKSEAYLGHAFSV